MTSATPIGCIRGKVAVKTATFQKNFLFPPSGGTGSYFFRKEKVAKTYLRGAGPPLSIPPEIFGLFSFWYAAGVLPMVRGLRAPVFCVYPRASCECLPFLLWVLPALHPPPANPRAASHAATSTIVRTVRRSKHRHRPTAPETE